MPIGNGRYSNIAVDDRKCTLCNLKPKEIGDEFHYLFRCPFIKEERELDISKDTSTIIQTCIKWHSCSMM